MTTAVLPFVQQRPRRSLMAWRWVLSGKRSAWFYLSGPDGPQEFWRQNERTASEHFARRHPGTRPWAWWKFSAPEPRRRLGGTGDTEADVLPAVKATYAYGVPDQWWDTGSARYYSRGRPIDPRNPPVFESEASFLVRHRLLVKGERRRLRKADFEPEAIA